MMLTIITGCPRSKFAISNGFSSKSVHVRPQVGKAKMCLRDIHFRGQNFIFEKKLKKIKIVVKMSQTHFGFTILGSDKHNF